MDQCNKFPIKGEMYEGKQYPTSCPIKGEMCEGK